MKKTEFCTVCEKYKDIEEFQSKTGKFKPRCNSCNTIVVYINKIKKFTKKDSQHITSILNKHKTSSHRLKIIRDNFHEKSTELTRLILNSIENDE